MKVLLTTGGTGGHVFPALAVAEELRKRDPKVELLFMGALYGPEQRLAERAGIPFEGIDVRGFCGRGLRGLGALLQMGLATPKAVGVLRRFSPDVAAGFGSYAAFVPLVVCRLLGVPYVLHEQNAVVGASNRFHAGGAKSVCVSLPGTGEGQFSSDVHVVVTGNPVRGDFFDVGLQPRSFDRKHLLVFGGSLGAKAINRLVVELLPSLRDAGIEVWHQTGKNDEAAVRKAYEANGMGHCRVGAFIDEMAEAYAWADVAICRSGASTVAELAAAALPSVLIPFPHAAADHQTGNARAVEQAGAALLLPERDVDARILKSRLFALLASPATLSHMSSKAHGLATPKAASDVADEIYRAAGAPL